MITEQTEEQEERERRPLIGFRHKPSSQSVSYNRNSQKKAIAWSLARQLK